MSEDNGPLVGERFDDLARRRDALVQAIQEAHRAEQERMERMARRDALVASCLKTVRAFFKPLGGRIDLVDGYVEFGVSGVQEGRARLTVQRVRNWQAAGGVGTDCLVVVDLEADPWSTGVDWTHDGDAIDEAVAIDLLLAAYESACGV